MNKILALALLIILSSCASLNTINSSLATSDKANGYCCYDTESKLYYQVSNDNENLYIKLNTSEPTSITKILKAGLKIYFDTEGKKNHDVFFQYPIAKSLELSEQNMAKQNMTQGPNINYLIAEYHTEALFNHFGSVDRFPIMLTNSDLEVSITAIDNSEINYRLTIPFHRISDAGISGISNLSIGVVSGKFNRPTSGNADFAPQQGMSGGGGKGGGRGGGGRGGMSGGRSGGADRSSMANPINIWFKVNLQEEE